MREIDLAPVTDSPHPIRVGISACLIGHKVRYNAGHTQSQLCKKQLGEYFDFTPFCPEVAAGFATPRPTMRLTGEPENPQLTFTNNSDLNLTQQLVEGFTPHLNKFEALDGYILMKNSPSCGMERVKVHKIGEKPTWEMGSGLFATALQKHFPLLPVEEEGRLHDPQLRENFITRVYAYHHFKAKVMVCPSRHKLMQFHSKYKFTLLAHNQKIYRQLGPMLANAHKRPISKVMEDYLVMFMQALSKPANRRNNTNALLHILGYVKENTDPAAKEHIIDTIYDYKDGLLPLITPLTLLRHYINQFGNNYIRSQSYLQPYPDNLGLRNQI